MKPIEITRESVWKLQDDGIGVYRTKGTARIASVVSYMYRLRLLSPNENMFSITLDRAGFTSLGIGYGF